MGLRDRIEASHDAVLQAEADLTAANAATLAEKQARLADDSGNRTAVPPDKRSC